MITLDGILYFVGLAVAMLYLNMVLLGRRHWAGGEASTQPLAAFGGADCRGDSGDRERHGDREPVGRSRRRELGSGCTRFRASRSSWPRTFRPIGRCSFRRL